ncbi:MAG: hypothetical protein ACJ75F_10580 [Flavisolibacter sp.]
MKKLLSIVCCVLYMHSFSQPSPEPVNRGPKTGDEKVLIKALATIVNPEGNKRTPSKNIQLSPNERP